MNLSTRNEPVFCVKRFLGRAASALTLAAALAFAVALFAAGCANPAGHADGSGTETPNRRYYARWDITDQNSPFASVELTGAGVYIVVEREGRPAYGTGTVNDAPAAPKLHVGRYEFASDVGDAGDTIVYLIEFGIMRIDLSSDNESGTIRLQPGSEISRPNEEPSGIVPPNGWDGTWRYEFSAERAAEIDSSRNTNLLCRQWEFERFLLNGELWEPWENPDDWRDDWEFPESEPQITNLFSKAGTYLQTLTVAGEEVITAFGQWRWVDENEDAFYHTDWMTGDWQPSEVRVALTETKLVITETLGRGDILTTEFKLLTW